LGWLSGLVLQSALRLQLVLEWESVWQLVWQLLLQLVSEWALVHPIARSISRQY
jgi:hypothetical protein